MNTWEKLSQVDVSGHIEKKGSLSYLSWAFAWGALMEHCPDSVYQFQDNEIHADGSVTVHCTLTVEGVAREMCLPVMDNRNKSIMGPTSRDISDAKMRCLVKAIAIFGLGHFLFSGEDLPVIKQTLPEYTMEQVEKNREEWVKLFDSKKAKPANIISKISEKYLLPNGLKEEILNMGAAFA